MATNFNPNTGNDCFDGDDLDWGVSYDFGGSFQSVDFSQFQNITSETDAVGPDPYGQDVTLGTQSSTVVATRTGADAVVTLGGDGGDVSYQAANFNDPVDLGTITITASRSDVESAQSVLQALDDLVVETGDRWSLGDPQTKATAAVQALDLLETDGYGAGLDQQQFSELQTIAQAAPGYAAYVSEQVDTLSRDIWALSTDTTSYNDRRDAAQDLYNNLTPEQRLLISNTPAGQALEQWREDANPFAAGSNFQNTPYNDATASRLINSIESNLERWGDIETPTGRTLDQFGAQELQREYPELVTYNDQGDAFFITGKPMAELTRGDIQEFADSYQNQLGSRDTAVVSLETSVNLPSAPETVVPLSDISVTSALVQDFDGSPAASIVSSTPTGPVNALATEVVVDEPAAPLISLREEPTVNVDEIINSRRASPPPLTSINTQTITTTNNDTTTSSPAPATSEVSVADIKITANTDITDKDINPTAESAVTSTDATKSEAVKERKALQTNKTTLNNNLSTTQNALTAAAVLLTQLNREIAAAPAGSTQRRNLENRRTALESRISTLEATKNSQTLALDTTDADLVELDSIIENPDISTAQSLRVSNLATTTTVSENVDAPVTSIASQSSTVLGGDFTEAFDVETNSFGVFDNTNGVFVETGLTQVQAETLAREATLGDPEALSELRDTQTGTFTVVAPNSPGGDFTAAFDVETGTYGVFDNTNGRFVETGLTQQEAAIEARAARIGDPNADLTPITAVPVDVPVSTEATSTTITTDYQASYDVESGTYGVFNPNTGTFVSTGLTLEQADQAAEQANVAATGQNQAPPAVDEDQLDLRFEPDGVNPDDDPGSPAGGVQEGTATTVSGAVGQESAVDPEGQAVIQAAADRARAQAAINASSGAGQNTDWRVRLSLADGANYLYREPGISEDGLLWPLRQTNGVIFPYTPQISTNYVANYSNYDLTHSNFRGYFYQNSYVDEVTITATFTAQDTSEANYLLAVIHFFRSVTKMFYGQDTNRGVPPPLVFLNGLGEFQFNNHPCVVKSFNYSLPDSVDYIRARSVNIANSTNLIGRRDLQALPVNTSTVSAARLSGSNLPPGGQVYRPAASSLGVGSPTYVPTKLEATITLLPMQTRQQVSQEFSLKQFANGDLIKSGFW